MCARGPNLKALTKKEKLMDAQSLRSIVDNLPAAIFVKDEELRFVLSNKHHDKLIGKSEDTLLGLSDADFYSPEAADGFMQRDRQVLQNGSLSEVEEEAIRQDGVRHIQVARKAKLVTPHGRTYLIGTCQDISETKRREEQQKLLAETVPVGVVQIDDNGSVRFANKLCLEYLGLHQKPDNFQPVQSALATVPPGFPGVKSRFETQVTARNGKSARFLVISSGWTSSPGEVQRVAIVSFVDITETTRLSSSLEQKSERLGNIIQQTQQSVMTIGTTSSALTDGAAALSMQTEAQLAQLEEMTTALRQLSAAVKQNSTNSDIANKLSLEAAQVASEGSSMSSSVSESMQKINAASKRVIAIVDLVQEIAFQTNILALNAAVEAARAGDAGRGFAVVASEVRTLAQRSGQALKDIKQQIDESTKQIAQGSDLVNGMSTKLTAISDSTQNVAKVVSQIAVASQQQTTGLAQVSMAASQLERSAQANASLVDRLTSSADTVDKSINNLMGIVSVSESEAA
jgi:PAS domain S-box-containing protein